MHILTKLTYHSEEVRHKIFEETESIVASSCTTCDFFESDEIKLHARAVIDFLRKCL